MKRSVLLLVGLALLALVVASQDLSELRAAASAIGWRFLWLAPLYLVGLGFGTLSWALLFAGGRRPSIPWLYGANWIGYAANQLLPVARIGGDLYKARLVRDHPSSAAESLGSVVADKTVQAFSLVVYAIVGCLALVWTRESRGLLGPVLATLAVLGFGIGFFARLQTRGLAGRTGRLLGRLLPEARREGLSASADEIDTAMRVIYRGRGRIARSIAAAFAFRLVFALEVWLTLSWMGHPASLLDAVMLESISQIIRAVTFLLPGAFGVQEGGLILMGSVIGVPAPAALMVSLVKRAREVLVGIPAIGVWTLMMRTLSRPSAGCSVELSDGETP